MSSAFLEQDTKSGSNEKYAEVVMVYSSCLIFLFSCLFFPRPCSWVSLISLKLSSSVWFYLLFNLNLNIFWTSLDDPLSDKFLPLQKLAGVPFLFQLWVHSPLTEGDFVCEFGLRQNLVNSLILGILFILDTPLHTSGKLQFLVHTIGPQIVKLSILLM